MTPRSGGRMPLTHSMVVVFSRAVGTDQAKIFAFSDDSKRNPVDGTAEQ